MRGVIKAGSGDIAVTAFSAAAVPAAAGAVPPGRSAVELALDDAHEEIAALQAALLAAHEAGADAERAAHEAGRGAGRAEAVADGARLADRVGAALDAARAAWDERLAELDTLAVMIARAALGRMFEAPADMADLVARAITQRIAALRADTIVAIHVSAADFAGEEACTALAWQAGVAAATIAADPALKAGECRIDLQLGHVDCGIAVQWRELDAFLAGLDGTHR